MPTLISTMCDVILVHFNTQSSCSLHGLIRGDNMELGRDSDTGGQVTLCCKIFFLFFFDVVNLSLVFNQSSHLSNSVCKFPFSIAIRLSM